MKTVLSLLAIIGIAHAQVRAPQYETQLRAIEEKVALSQRQLGVPGLALVIVKDDQIIYQNSMGYRDVEKKLPVTSKTLFRIGSVTKSFTAFMAMMAAEEGKLSLVAHPATYLPYFKLSDPKANRDVTLANLLSHTTGLAPHAGDFVSASGKFNKRELIELMGLAKPMWNVGEGFGYSNIMYAAIGEILAKVYRRPYEDLITQRLFKPLGMLATTFSLKAMLSNADHSNGYSPQGPHSQLNGKDLTTTAAAGGINSNIEDMSRFLRLAMGRGFFSGKRYLSEQGWEELSKPRISVEPLVKYGYGWDRVTFSNSIGNSGNIDGFNARIAFLPRHNVGFVLLTNVTDSRLKLDTELAIWDAFAGKEASTLPKQPDKSTVAATPLVPTIEVAQLAEAVRKAEAPDSALRLKYRFERENEGIGGDGTFTLSVSGGWNSHLRITGLGRVVEEMTDSCKEKTDPYIYLLRSRPMTAMDFGWASMLDASGTSIPWTGAKIVDVVNIGGEEAYVVLKQSSIGPIRECYSVKSSLLLQRVDAAQGVQTFADYRAVGGKMIPFLRTSVAASQLRSKMQIAAATPQR